MENKFEPLTLSLCDLPLSADQSIACKDSHDTVNFHIKVDLIKMTSSTLSLVEYKNSETLKSHQVAY